MSVRTKINYINNNMSLLLLYSIYIYTFFFLRPNVYVCKNLSSNEKKRGGGGVYFVIVRVILLLLIQTNTFFRIVVND